ncbi:hypothetical protein [Curtobacterium luteum]|uniref:Uncharacterized protein n=1 Tax=Curtobacterium luteum TaxID=33881 RepID=A0A175RZI3_9MICO|nr:hypothetical protein [Curtobacterium luteum]KTR09098.1 hypothetical protein NS184_03715 [Curtobacterium luteum]
MIQVTPTLLLIVAVCAMLWGIVERFAEAAQQRDLAGVLSVFNGFPVFLGLIGATLITLAMRTRSRSRSEQRAFRKEARWDPIPSASEIAELDDASRRLRHALRRDHREAVRRDARELGSARSAAAASYERLGNLSLCAAAVFAAINWVFIR